MVVASAANHSPASFGPRLRDAHRRLADSGLALTVGISTTVSTLAEIPEAYREANAARIAVGQTPGVVSQYVASDLNARRAAQNLHVHVNTAHFRLARIAERTGCDLNKVGDLIEILIAARLGDAAARHGHAVSAPRLTT